MNTHWEWKMIFSFILETKTPCMHVCLLSHFSCVRLSVTLQTIARQALLSVGVSRQEYWSGLLCPPRDPPDPDIQQCLFTALPLLRMPAYLLLFSWLPVFSLLLTKQSDISFPATQTRSRLLKA